MRLLRPKIMLKHFLHNTKNKFEKVQKTTFSTPKMSKNYPSNRSKVGSILTENLDFQSHLSTFRAENTPKSRPFKTKNNAVTLPK